MAYDPTGENGAKARGLDEAQLRAIQETFALSNDRISELSESKLIGILRKLDLPDRPLERARFERLFELGDERTTPPPEAKQRALQQLDEVRAASAPGPVAGVPAGPAVSPRSLSPPPLPTGAGLSPTGAGWTSLGPGRVGGRTRCIVVDPDDADRMWAGSVGGGLWITTNAGANWHPVDDRMANLAVTCAVVDPANARILYAGTGEGFFNLDAIRGAGIFRTVNGTAWSQLAATTTPDFHYVNRLAISADGEVLLAATRTGIFRSADPDRQTWTLVHAGNMADVRCHPSDPLRAVAGGLRDGFAHFTDDGGLTWQAATRPNAFAGRVELAYSAADPSVVYASVDDQNGRIWRSQDGGQSYAARSSHNANGVPANYLGQQGWYDNTLWAGDPTDADLVIVGGIDLWRSTDGGGTLEPISDWTDDTTPHADHHAVVSHPGFDGTTNRTAFFGNDGGIWRGADVRTVDSGGGGWTSLVNGYAVTQFYGAAGHTPTGTLVAGAQDNGTQAFHPAQGVDHWVEIFGGDGGWCAADPVDPNVFYGEYVYLGIFRNTNGATSSNQWWNTYISGEFFNNALGRWDWKPLPFRIPDAMNQRALFIAPFVLDPNDADRILGGGLSLWRTNDAKTANTQTSGPSWAAIKHSVGSPISAIAIASGDSDLVWVGHENGEVYRSDDATGATPTWQLVSHTGAFQPSRMCTRVVIDPVQHQRAYAMFAGYNAGNLWRTEDHGATWTDLGAGLPEAPVRTLAMHPRRPEYLYAGTEVGVFTSEDDGATWSPTNEGPTNTAVAELFWMGEVLVCATHGRGMFSIDLSGVPSNP